MSENAPHQAIHRLPAALMTTARLPGSVAGDARITAAARHYLRWHLGLPTHSLTVRVEQGWLTLDGEFETAEQKQVTAIYLGSLAELRGVTDRTAIARPSGGKAISDEIAGILRFSWICDCDGVRVTANNGTVRLTGSVRSSRGRWMAESTAWSTPGVVAVENDLRIESLAGA